MGPNRRPDRDDPAAPGPLSAAAAAALLERADELAGTGDYERALAAYGRLIGHADAEVHVAALLGIGECRYRLDDDEGALQAWISATQAPETALTWRAWKQLAAARVRQNDLPGAARSYREAERRAPPWERPEIASRLGWLSKEMGNERSASRHFGRSRARGADAPSVTYAVLAVTIAIGVSSLINPATEALAHSLLALDKSAVARGELYRLLTVVLVHAGGLQLGILHLASNMYALYLTGPLAEALYGKVVFLAVYLLSAAGASAASYIFVPNDAVGASGAIFGLFGLLAVAYRVHRPLLPRHARALMSRLGMLIAFNLILGFGLAGRGIPLDNAAHVGGLLAGAWLGLVIAPRGALNAMWQRPRGEREAAPAVPAGRSLLRGAAVALLVAVIAVGVLYGTEVRRKGRAELQLPPGAAAAARNESRVGGGGSGR